MKKFLTSAGYAAVSMQYRQGRVLKNVQQYLAPLVYCRELQDKRKFYWNSGLS
jgi:hypothetical protein